jgi:hypothetical protein
VEQLQVAGTNNPGGAGGNGLRSSIVGPAYSLGAPGPLGTGYFAGGGGGNGNSATPNNGGYGGGGPGAPGNAFAGTFSTGGGGGGSWNNFGGNGGSGIVVVRYQIAELTATAKATGGAISYYNGKTIHTFTNSGTFNVTDGPISAEFFMVAGGGGGGFDAAGGGGGGGVVYHPGLTVGPGPYAVTIGSGGVGGTSQPVKGSDGGDTTIAFPTTYTAYRGGGGGSRSSTPGSPGGSGGGGARVGGSGGSATQPAANPGATEYGNSGGTAGDYGAGGGGAGNAGQPYPEAPAVGWGGIGIQAPPTFRNPDSPYGGYVPGTPTRAWGFAGGGGGGGNTASTESYGGA